MGNAHPRNLSSTKQQSNPTRKKPTETPRFLDSIFDSYQVLIQKEQLSKAGVNSEITPQILSTAQHIF